MKQTFIEFLQEGDVIPFPKKNSRQLLPKADRLLAATSQSIKDLFDDDEDISDVHIEHKPEGVVVDVIFDGNIDRDEVEEIVVDALTGAFMPLRPTSVQSWDGVDDTSVEVKYKICLLYTSPSPRDGLLSRMPSSA